MSSEYKFTRVFDETATQTSIFEETCLPLLAPILRQDNYKALILSHGATKSGKTHSTMGSSGQAGIIPRTLKVLFDSIAKSTQDINTPTQYRPFRVHDVEFNIDERRDSETIESIRAMDTNLATWIQKLALSPLEFNAGDLLVENQSSRNPQGTSCLFMTNRISTFQRFMSSLAYMSSPCFYYSLDSVFARRHELFDLDIMRRDLLGEDLRSFGSAIRATRTIYQLNRHETSSAVPDN